jgi:hypothetical protein
MRTNKFKQNSELHHFIDAQPFPRRVAWMTSHQSDFRGTNSNRCHTDLLALLANVYFTVDELAKELKDKSKGYKTKPSRAQFEKLTQIICPQLPSACSPITATTARTRDSTSFCRINA